MTRRTCVRAGILLAALGLAVGYVRAYPKPSAYPISWQFEFRHSEPKRLVVTPPDSKHPVAYWYMTYTVINTSKQEQTFLPRFELLGDDGNVSRSDEKIPQAVYDTIRVRERNRAIETVTQIEGTIRVGEDQGRDGVAVWTEPDPRMGRFSIFAAGLSGESVILTDDAGKPVTKKNAEGKDEPVVLRKTLQLNYSIPGDEKFPGRDVIEKGDQEWVMR